MICYDGYLLFSFLASTVAATRRLTDPSPQILTWLPFPRKRTSQSVLPPSGGDSFLLGGWIATRIRLVLVHFGRLPVGIYTKLALGGKSSIGPHQALGPGG
jgi:hypothetical protein